MDYEYEGADDLGGRILWGRVAVFVVIALVLVLLGRCTAGGGGVDQAVVDEVQSELALAQAQVADREGTIAELQDRVEQLLEQLNGIPGGTTTDGTQTPTTDGTQTGTTGTDPTTPGNPTAGQIYTVQSGDTLSGIAAQVYGDPGAFGIIAEANGISDSNPLQVGQQLTIPPNPDTSN